MSRLRKSIISTIKDSIVNETQDDVTITERSLLSQLLEKDKTQNKHDENNIGKEDFKCPKYKGRRFVLTHHLVRIPYYIAFCLLGFFDYIAQNLFYRTIYGMDKACKHTKIRTSRRINALVLVSTAVIALVILVYIVSFLVKDLIFSPNEAHTNLQGVVTIDQPCLEQQSFILLNAAGFWTNSGIQVQKGDRIIITTSGSMYSDICEMDSAAINNDTLKYPRSCNNENYTNALLCLYGRDGQKDARFGSLLCQVANEAQGQVSYATGYNKIRQLKPNGKETSFTAKEGGLLRFAYNDILLDHKTLSTIYNTRYDASELPFTDLKKSLIKSNPSFNSDSIDARRNLFVNYCTNNLISNDSTIWFKDNIGEALINVRIERNIWKSDIGIAKKHLVWIARTWQKTSNCIRKTLVHKCIRREWRDFVYGLEIVIIGLLALVVWLLIDLGISTLLRKTSMSNTNNNTNKTMTKEEFKVLVMLYAANVDGQIHADEVDAMMERSDKETYARVKKMFGKMGDSEILDCIRENKAKYAATEDERNALLEDLYHIIMADEKVTTMERHIFNAITKILA